MAERITDEMIEYVILAKLEPTAQEKETAKLGYGEDADYIDILNELDTSQVEPMIHIFPVSNVFREDGCLQTEEQKRLLMRLRKG